LERPPVPPPDKPEPTLDCTLFFQLIAGTAGGNAAGVANKAQVVGMMKKQAA
jgi:hypothetical protein